MVEVSSTVILQVLHLLQLPRLDPLLVVLSSLGRQPLSLHRPLSQAPWRLQPPLQMVKLPLELMANAVVKGGLVPPPALQDTPVWFRTHVSFLLMSCSRSSNSLSSSSLLSMYPQLILHDSFKVYLHNTNAQSILLKLTRSLIIRRLQQKIFFSFQARKAQNGVTIIVNGRTVTFQTGRAMVARLSREFPTRRMRPTGTVTRSNSTMLKGGGKE